MFDRLREFVSEKLGRGGSELPVQTTVDHGYFDPDRHLDLQQVRAESFGQGSGTIPAKKLEAGILGVPVITGSTPVDTAGAINTLIEGGRIPDGTVLRNRFDIPNPVATILDYAARIRNDRTELTILRHARDDEMVELEDEVEAWGSLPPRLRNTDRVIAEAMDVVGCMVDLIHHVRPDITLAELDTITKTFCERWAAKYGKSAGKPAGTDARAQRDKRRPMVLSEASDIIAAGVRTTEFIIDCQYRADSIKQDMARLGFIVSKTERRSLPEGYYWLCFRPLNSDRSVN